MFAIRPAAAFALAVALLAAVPSHAPAAARVDIGPVVVRNDYSGWVTVRLYHADAVDRVFATWRFCPNEISTLALNGEVFNIGGDWLIDVRFDNGVRSHRRLVWKAGRFDGRWHIDLTDVYHGR